MKYLPSEYTRKSPVLPSALRAFCLFATIAISPFLFACGSGESTTNFIDTPRRGCQGCLNVSTLPGMGPRQPLPSVDYITARQGTEDFAYRTLQIGEDRDVYRLFVSTGNKSRSIDTFLVDTTFFRRRHYIVQEILPIQWSPYSEEKLLIEIHFTDSSLAHTQQNYLAVLNLANDSIGLLYNEEGTQFFRTPRGSYHRLWSPYSRSGQDTLYVFQGLAEFIAYSFQSRITSIDYETIPFRRSPNDKHVLQRFSRNWPNWQEQNLWLDRELLNHNFDTAESVRHWAWSEDSRYAGFLWLAKGPAPMPVVPNLDTLPSDRYPCRMEEIAIFDVKSPRTDSLGRPIPVHRWKPHEKLCLYAVHTQRFAFNNRGNLLMGLQDRDRNVSNLYEVTIDGRLVRQLTNY